jgi:hypothetical protein
MMRSSTLQTLLSGLSFLLLSSLGAASCGGDDGGASDFVAACQKYCTAQAAPMCAKGLAEDSCKSQCGAGPAVFGDVCVPELTAALDCTSGLEFTCTKDFPTPKATGCLSEATALNTCQQNAPCQGYCKAAIAAGCGGASEDACIEACKAEVEKQSFCGHDLQDVRTCEGKQSLSCAGGKPHTALCVDDKRNYADCLSFDDPCSAYCFLADDAGCAGGTMGECIMACQTDLGSQSCSFESRQYLQCAAEKGVTCAGTMATVPECTTEKNAYDMCAKP